MTVFRWLLGVVVVRAVGARGVPRVLASWWCVYVCWLICIALLFMRVSAVQAPEVHKASELTPVRRYRQ